MQRKHLVAAYIAAFETILSWDKWDGAIEMIMVTLMFWGINVILMIMAEMEEENDADYKSHQKRKASGKRKRRAA